MNKKHFIYPLLLSFLMVGCDVSKESGSIDPTPPEIEYTGYYVDDPVIGLDYECGKYKGTTNENGSFQFEIGKPCYFSVGKMKLRDVSPEFLKENGIVLVETDPRITALLQSFKIDSNATEIIIPDEIKGDIDAEDVPATEENLTLFIEGLKQKTGMNGLQTITFNEAEDHILRITAEVKEKFGNKVVELPERTDLNETVVLPTYKFETMTDEFFNALPQDQKITVANKLFLTMFKGKTKSEIENMISSETFISDMKNLIHAEDVEQPDLDKIYIDTYEIPYDSRAGDRLYEKQWRIFSEIFSKLYYTKISKEYFDEWIAYILEQTIMFSPAYEVESVTKFPELIKSNYRRVRDDIKANKSIREVVYNHMISKENWSRFRSPEDNGREMLEIWLYDYNDSHVPIAAEALKNWRWEVRREQNESGVYGDVYKFYNDETNPEEINTVTLEIDGKKFTTGTDYYKMIENHENLIPTVVDRIVNKFFPDFDADKKKAITKAIVETNPVTFEDIFEQILFSKNYLLETSRMKTTEEVFTELAQKLNFSPDGTNFRYFMQDCMFPASQAPFVYKFGRIDGEEQDSDSIIRMHQYIRTNVFLNRTWGWSSSELISRYDTTGTTEGFLNNMFEDIVGRKMNEDEKNTLIRIITNAGINVEEPRDWDKFAITLMTFDYFSRLSDTYMTKSVEVEEGGEQ